MGPLLLDRLWPKDAANARPLMPLRKGHLAMLSAAGFLNNLCLAANGSHVLVKGLTYKEYVLTESTARSYGRRSSRSILPRASSRRCRREDCCNCGYRSGLAVLAGQRP